MILLGYAILTIGRIALLYVQKERISKNKKAKYFGLFRSEKIKNIDYLGNIS